MKLTKPYIVVYNPETLIIVISGKVGNTIVTPYTVAQFDTEEQMNTFIEENKLINQENE